MANLDRLFQPTYKNKQASGTRGPQARDDAAAIKTYRYLRLGMVVTVLALVVAIVVQWLNSTCWRGSISAYYYSPARPVFVSGLAVIAVLLIVIKGSTVVEDLLLSIAGMLAPIVAFVPTTDEPLCHSGPFLTPAHGKLPPDVIMDVHNNITTSLFAGFAALVIAIVVLIIEQWKNDKVATGDVVPRIILLLVTGLLLGGGVVLLVSDAILQLHGWFAVFLFAALACAALMAGLWLFRINGVNGPNAPRHWGWFELLYLAVNVVIVVVGAIMLQGWSAISLFAALACASLVNGMWLIRIRKDIPTTTSPHWKALGVLYVAVGLLMAFTGAIIKKWPGDWDHRILALEMTEIGLFVAMWLVQTVEKWGKVLQAKA